MTAIDGQLDIFDQLNPVRTVECPHCGVVWTPGKHLDDEQALDVHTRRNGGPDEDMPGECVGQRMALSGLLARAVPSDVNYRGDLLSALIDVRRKRVEKTAVLGILALAEKRMGETA